MTQQVTEQQLYCAVIPTYNNAGTLEKVLMDVAQYVSHVIVVNDGSTDHSRSLLEDMQKRHAFLDVIHLPANNGKGKALQTGFERALTKGFRYAITIDSDGQHFADDIPLFTEMIQKYPDNLIVGARNMQQDGVPGKSSFGNRFSNFWYKVETGNKLPDTQSGFRLYPLEFLRDMRFFTRKFEFEVEVLVRASWKGCRIRCVPVKIYYASDENRVSHFRPIRDFARISLLNTVLVLVALLWIKPRDLIRKLQWQKIKRFFHQQFINPKHSALHSALSAGFGVFMGILPIWGYQLLAAIALAHLMKLNKAIVFITANVSLPPMIPVILYISFLTGGWLVGGDSTTVSLSVISLNYVKNNLYQYLVGSVVFAIVAGIAVMLLVWLAVFIMRWKKEKKRLRNAFLTV